MTQSEYYLKHGIDPLNLGKTDGDADKRYMLIRRNLYDRLLGLPMSLLKGHDVLEVGCGTGECSLVLAKHGARVTLLDADPRVKERIEQLFQRSGYESTVRRITNCYLEDYQDDVKFSLVTAEGFLATLDNRDAALRKIASFIAVDGFGTVSFPDRFGSFMEFIKKAAFERAIQLARIDDRFSDAARAVAWSLFERCYNLLPNPREFTVWWKDCICAPFLNYEQCWAYDEILAVVSEVDCVFHSSTPRIHEPHPLTWYKTLTSPQARYEETIKGYKQRKFDFMFGEIVNVPVDAPQYEELEGGIVTILKKLSAYFADGSETHLDIDFSKLRKLFNDMEVKHPLLGELEQFFKLLSGNSADDLIKGYAAMDGLATAWGNSYHYICFRKRAMD